ncbi:MAG: hypothetical protein WDM79_19055 [Terricaulis sp.]
MDQSGRNALVSQIVGQLFLPPGSGLLATRIQQSWEHWVCAKTFGGAGKALDDEFGRDIRPVYEATTIGEFICSGSQRFKGLAVFQSKAPYEMCGSSMINRTTASTS